MFFRPFGLAILGITLTLTATVSTASPRAPIDVKHRILAILTHCHDALKTGDAKTFVSGYADDALFVDEGGFMTKKRLAGLLKGFQLDHYKLADIHFTTLTNHSWTLAYRITEYGTFGGKAFVNKAIISTVWAEQNHKLLCHLVQETTVK